MSNSNLECAILSLEGLAMGDAYGNHHGKNTRKHHAPVWEYSDDTIMAMSIIQNLSRYDEINQDALAQSFAQRWDGQRGYGRGVTRLLKQIQKGAVWQKASKAMFDGQGSFGNGSAMRVAPIGAYFADDLSEVVQQARKSAIVTHAHREDIAGAIAVAVGAALVIQHTKDVFDWKHWLADIVRYTPESEVRDKIRQAIELDGNTQDAVKILGNGRPAIAQTTVAFALWCAGNYMNDYGKAIRQTASARGDVDTNCAIVGGIVVLATGLEGIPSDWLEKRESLAGWMLSDEVIK